VFIADTSLRKRFINMQRGEVYFSRRINIETLEQREGAPFKFGYDFFVAHADDISGVNSCMVFGAPWWDHFFPLTMHMRDHRVRQIESCIVHLKHNERWSFATWETLGRRFVCEIFPIIDLDYKRRLQLVAGLNICKEIFDNAESITPAMLHMISDVNILYLDQCRIVH
jgi:hypothetical protein